MIVFIWNSRISKTNLSLKSVLVRGQVESCLSHQQGTVEGQGCQVPLEVVVTGVHTFTKASHFVPLKRMHFTASRFHLHFLQKSHRASVPPQTEAEAAAMATCGPGDDGGTPSQLP